MHGILFKQLKTYVESEWGEDTWESVMDEADIEPKLYLPVTDYPDDEAVRLIDGVVTLTDRSRQQLLEEFGEHLAPALLDTFEAHIREDWDAMDLLEHSGNQVFSVLRSEESAQNEVTAARDGPDAVTVHYGSPLEMCSMAKGVLRGIADEHGEDVTVTEQACQHRGADACDIRISRA